MDRNTITGFVLIALILFGFAWWQQPSEEQIKQQRIEFVKDSIAATKKSESEQLKAKQDAIKAQQAINDTTSLFYTANNAPAKDIVLRNDKLELTLNTKGGTVKKALVKNFVGHDLSTPNGSKDTKDLTLFEGADQELNFVLPLKNQNIETKDLTFAPSNISDSTLTLTATTQQGKRLIIDYKLGKTYLLHMAVKAEGMKDLFQPNLKQIIVNWEEKAKQLERGHSFENRHATLTFKKSNGGTDHLSESAEAEERTEVTMDWVAFKNQFFSAVLISKDGFNIGAKLKSTPQTKESHYLKSYKANMEVAFDTSGSQASEFEMYFGPNDYRLLQSIEDNSKFGKELDLEELVYLGWPIVRTINRWFTLYLFDWLRQVFPIGIVLIIITLLLKLITFPMVKKSYMSSAKMRVLKPKIEEATKQYSKPEDQMAKSQAMMQKYAEYGVSPLSGCLPMLIQMPIWIAMFNFLPTAIQLRGEKFLWMQDLSTYDPIIRWGQDLWLIGDHISLTCILFCATNILYTWFTMQQQKDQMMGQQAEQMKMMQWMMYLMPLAFFFMFNDYSSGLNFYYFLSLFFSAAIMWTLRKTTNEEKLLAQLEKRREEIKNNPQKQGGLAARLQALQEMQMKQQEELRKKQKR